MDRDLPKLRDYDLVLQLGHTTDYQVYLARSARSARLLALRQARPSLDPEMCGPLVETILALEANPHPHLPQVVDVGTEDDVTFWVSDYIEGDTLDSLSKEKQQDTPLPVLLRISLDVASGLKALAQLGEIGPVLPEDVFVGTDGAVRLIPPVRWNSRRRMELRAFALHSQEVPQDVLYLSAFIWECKTQISVASCMDGDRLTPLSGLVPGVGSETEQLLEKALGYSGAAFPNLRSFVHALSAQTDGVASRAEVAEWLKQTIRQRLETRTRVMRSKPPKYPSGAIPLVKFPDDLSAVKLSSSYDERAATDRPVASPTIPTPQPLADDEAARSNRPSSIRTSTTPEAGEANSDSPSSAPSSSVRDAAGDEPSPPRKQGSLATAVAEYVKGLGRNRRSS